jgi:uncharacterized protein (TIGR02145 family)
MKKITLIIFIALFSCGGEKRKTKIYGNQEWTVENAAHITYQDGTPIPQVVENVEWANLTTGAWCFYNNDPAQGVLYNWYALAGIHDTDPNTPNKEFAPLGWHVPDEKEWQTLTYYLFESGYGDALSKSMASPIGWMEDSEPNFLGNNQVTNNGSGFNAMPKGNRYGLPDDGIFSENDGSAASFWTSTTQELNSIYKEPKYAKTFNLYAGTLEPEYFSDDKSNGLSVRLVKD